MSIRTVVPSWSFLTVNSTLVERFLRYALHVCAANGDINSGQHWPTPTPWFNPRGLNLVVLFRMLFFCMCEARLTCVPLQTRRVFVWPVQPWVPEQGPAQDCPVPRAGYRRHVCSLILERKTRWTNLQSAKNLHKSCVKTVKVDTGKRVFFRYYLGLIVQVEWLPC